MTIDDALRSVAFLFLDTAPVIYFVEKNPAYVDRVKDIFGRIDNGVPTGVTSPVTLAEALVHPIRRNLTAQQQDFIDVIVAGHNVRFLPIDYAGGIRAAELRAKYNLSLTDALQISSALSASCEAFLTNDFRLKKVTEIPILVLDELTT